MIIIMIMITVDYEFFLHCYNDDDDDDDDDPLLTRRARRQEVPPGIFIISSY